jgi:glutamate dehydrogenase
MQSKELNVICSQLLTQNDLNVSDKLFDDVQKNGIVASILENNDLKSIKIFSKTQIFLSQITPILHDMGFVIVDEVTYSIEKSKEMIFISKFNLSLDDTKKVEQARENIEAILSLTLKHDNMHNCKLYSLIYSQNFSLQKVMLLRAIIEYLDQAVLTLSRTMITTTLTTYDAITNMFIDYFLVKFDPKSSRREKKLKDLECDISEKIKIIPHINDDKILKLTLSLLKSFLRTNYFMNKESIALKIDTKTFSENLKGLQPNIESFVYSTKFYGIHLRMSNISRGGLRWSDRHDDYRQEVKSLMITQQGKNSIIIPDGSKGGFVINKEKSEITPEYFKEIYSKYINNMLDLVDNRVDGEVVQNPDMVCYDDEDPYFVVAADKGTAAMSDVANQIAVERGYWLGDAFASGGSNGYGHKDLGITARGSIMSTRRFFLEEGIDIYKDEISTVGIGSMNGDVFGNGLIETPMFKLFAAIGHKEIFIDPKPNIEKAYEERKRIFFDKKSSWSHYNKKLISKGGGVFLRADKEINLSLEIQKMIGCTRSSMSGEELCKEILKMKVDLLFNGGVGTYVKATDENSLDIGDKQNEAVRIDASEIRAKMVCEGGNLGLTQKARIEYAINGGKINIDGIDNAGGVDTSDREVNLKILLNGIKSQGILDEAESNKTLHSLTDQVVGLVLQSNYNQALAISRDERLSRSYTNDFLLSIETLENNLEEFNRKDFYIPKNQNIKDVMDSNGNIVRPVLCSLFSYSKIFVRKLLLESTLIDEQFAVKFLYRYFPKSFVGAYEHEILSHPLKREILATKIADIIINAQGITFISDYVKLGHDKFLLKIKSYLIVKELFSAKEIKDKLFTQDYLLDVDLQYKLINKLEYTLYSSTRWMLKYLKRNQIDSSHILDYKDELFEYLSSVHNEVPETLIEGDDSFNRFFAVIDYLRFAVAAIVIKESTTHSFKDVVVLFYSLIHEFNILEIIVSLNRLKINEKSDMTLRNQVLQFIEFIVVHYTEKILEFQRVNETPEDAFKNYIDNDSEVFEKLKKNLEGFAKKEEKDIKEIAITVNQLMVSLI